MSQLSDLKTTLAQLVYDPDRLRGIPQAAEYLGTTDGALRALIKRGELKTVQIGTTTYIAQSAIHEWIERSHKRQELEQYRNELTKK